jgi:hypothetical protein
LVEHTSGTGKGGGEFTAVSGSAADDNGIVIVTANGVRVERNVSAVNPYMYGATGSGTETAAIQAAFDSGYPVYFPVVFTTGKIVLTRSVRLYSKTNGGLKKANSVNDYLIANVSNVADNFTIFADGLIIDGNQANQTIGGDTSDIRIHQDGDGVLTVEHKFIRCSFKNCSKHSIYVRCVNTGRTVKISLIDCKFTGGALQTASFGVEYLSFSTLIDAYVDGCRFDYGNSVSSPNSPPTAVSFTHRTSDVSQNELGEITIVNSQFRRVGRSQSNALGALSIYAGANHVTLSNLKFIDCYGQGLEVKTHSKNINISNITIDGITGHGFIGSGFALEGSNVDDGIGGPYFVQGRMAVSNIIIANVEGIGMLLESSPDGTANQEFRNLVMDNVVIENCTSHGIDSRTIRDFNFTNIRIRDVDGVGMRFEDNYGYGMISNCNVSSNNDAAIYSVNSPDLFMHLSNGNFATNSGTRCGELQGMTELQLSDSTFDGGSTTDLRIGGYTRTSRVRNVTADLIGYSGSLTELNVSDIITTRTFPGTLIIASGIVTPYENIHLIDTEGAAATDDLDTINGGYVGRRLTLRTSSGARDVTIKHSTGNIRLNSGADFVLASTINSITLTFDGANWLG